MSAAYQIQRFRENYRLSQSQLGLLIGKSRATVASYENGATEPDGAVTGLLRLLDGRPTREIIGMMSNAQNPSELDPDLELKKLEHFLIDDAKTVSKPVRADDPESPWRTYRGAATRRFNLATIERLGQATVPAASGGFLTTEATREALGPLAINSRLSRLGANYVGADSTITDFRIPMISDPAAYWIREGEAMPEVAVSFAAENVGYTTVGTSLALSRRLLQLTAGAGMKSIAQAMSRSLAREVDRAVLIGSGTAPEPRGIVNHPGLVQLDCATASFDSRFYEAIETLENNGVNSERLSVIVHPGTKKALSQVGTDQAELEAWISTIGPRGPVQSFRGLPGLSLPNYTDNRLLIGDFSQVTVRVSSEIELKILDASRPDGAHVLFAFLDLAIENPYASQAFVELNNVFPG